MSLQLPNTAVILNGPPGVGKDTIAGLIVKHGFAQMAFKDYIYPPIKEYCGLNDVELAEFRRRAADRELKDKVWALTDETPRRMIIHVSENIIKPQHGDSYFGVCAMEDAALKGNRMVVFSDGGFESEWPPLLEYFDLVVVFRLYRDGFTFEGDSRDYLTKPEVMYDLQLSEGYPGVAAAQIMNYLITDLFPQFPATA